MILTGPLQVGIYSVIWYIRAWCGILEHGVVFWDILRVHNPIFRVPGPNLGAPS